MHVATSTAPDWRISPDPVPYQVATDRMREVVAGIRSYERPEEVWLLEHPPLYTAGTSARAADLTNPNQFQTFDAGRGGQWTYHGPGQLVAYVMLDLTRPHGHVAARDTHAYVAGLEEWLMAALATFGVQGLRRDGRVGLWVPNARTGHDDKIAAIGVRITRWVSWHGVAINVHPELEHFAGIVPCGIRDHGVTSLRALGIGATLADVRAVLRDTWQMVFG